MRKLKKNFTAMIFGISGQDGSYLADFLLKKNTKFLVPLEILVKKISKILLD